MAAAAARRGLLALAAVEGRADLPHQAGRARDGEVDLHGNGQAGLVADLLRGRRIALRQGFIDHHGQILATPQCGQRRLAPLGHFDFHAQLRSHDRSAVARAFDSRHHQNAHVSAPSS
jgi:hypothetical protein